MGPRSTTRHASRGPIFVGRQREREILLSLLSTAAEGQGRMALISGPAGIGKSTLVQELITDALDRDFRVLVGACYDGFVTAPYEPWYEALSYEQDTHPTDANDLISLLQVSTSDSPAIDDERTLTRALVAALTRIADDRPALLVLEDLHWADKASLDLLLRVARSLPRMPFLFTVTWRDGARAALAGSPAMASLARSPASTRLVLQRLSEAEIEEWLGLRYGLDGKDLQRLSDLLGSYADGNPLFVDEVLRELELSGQVRFDQGRWSVGGLRAIGVPPVVQQVISARLDAFDPDARNLLAAGAVLGQAFPSELLEAVSGVDGDLLVSTIAAAQQAHILHPTGRAADLEFEHALIRNVLYQDLVQPVRRDIHRRAADELMSGAVVDPDRVAGHLLAAGDTRAADWLMLAGDRAERAHAWEDAVRRFRQVLSVLPQMDTTERLRGWLSYRIAYLLRHSDIDGSRDALDDALASAHTSGDRTLLAYARYIQGLLHVFSGNWQRGIGDLLEAIELLENLPALDRWRLNASQGIFNPDVMPLPTSRFEPPHRPETPDGLLAGDIDRRATVGSLLAESGRLDEALDLLASCRAASEDAPTAQTGHILQTSAYVHALAGRTTDSAADFEEASRRFEGSARSLMLFDCLASQLIALDWPYHADRTDERETRVAEIRRLGERLGEFMAPGLSYEHWLIYTHFQEGRWDLVEKLINSPGLTARAGRHHQHISWVAALLMREWGRPEEAWAWLRPQLPDGERTEPGNTEFLSATRAMVLAAELALDTGGGEAAERWLAAHARWMEWSGAVLGLAEAELARARVARLAGDRDAAREHGYRALGRAVEPRQPLAQVAAQRFIGVLDIEAGDHEAAGEHIDRAVSLAENCKAAHELIASRIARVALLSAGGRLAEAQELAAEARAAAEALSARRLLDVLDGLDLRKESEPDQLTAREIEVLELVARGRTDAEVADALFIATRTVNAHMRSIRSKLQANSRMRAVQLARERGLI